MRHGVDAAYGGGKWRECEREGGIDDSCGNEKSGRRKRFLHSPALVAHDGDSRHFAARPRRGGESDDGDAPLRYLTVEQLLCAPTAPDSDGEELGKVHRAPASESDDVIDSLFPRKIGGGVGGFDVGIYRELRENGAEVRILCDLLRDSVFCKEGVRDQNAAAKTE